MPGAHPVTIAEQRPCTPDRTGLAPPRRTPSVWWSGREDSLVLGGTAVAEAAVQPPQVVPAFDPLKDRGVGGCPTGHGRTTAVAGGPQCVGDRFGPQVDGGGPAGHAAGSDVDDGGRVQPVLLGRAAGWWGPGADGTLRACAGRWRGVRGSARASGSGACCGPERGPGPRSAEPGPTRRRPGRVRCRPAAAGGRPGPRNGGAGMRGGAAAGSGTTEPRRTKAVGRCTSLRPWHGTAADLLPRGVEATALSCG
jgi:hypothetical protein